MARDQNLQERIESVLYGWGVEKSGNISINIMDEVLEVYPKEPSYEQGWNDGIEAAANECLRRCDDNPHDYHWRRHSLPRAIRALTPASFQEDG